MKRDSTSSGESHKLPTRRVLTIAVAAALSIGLVSHVAAGVRPENKWRIQCSEGAKSEGTIVFRVTPEGGSAVEVRVEVKDGTMENNVARRIRKAFRETLPKGDFKIELDDNEDVLVKRRLGSPKFALELVANDVRAVRINLDRE